MLTINSATDIILCDARDLPYMEEFVLWLVTTAAASPAHVYDENTKARPVGIADFRNQYATEGRRKDETDIWKGRGNGPSAQVIDALLQNQLYALSQQQQCANVGAKIKKRDIFMDTTQVAYESDY